MSVQLQEVPQEQLRAAISRLCCPWCGAGPFVVLAGHTARAHGVTADELRALADLNRTTPTCSRDFSQRCRVRNQAWDQQKLDRCLQKGRARQREPVTIRGEGRQRFRERSARPEIQEVFRQAMSGLDRSRIAKNRSEAAVQAQTQRVQAARDRWIQNSGEEAVRLQMSRVGRAAAVATFGTPEGRPDTYFALYTREFIAIAAQGKARGAFARYARRAGVSATAVRRTIRVAIARGIATDIGLPYRPRVALTDKGVAILEGDAQ